LFNIRCRSTIWTMCTNMSGRSSSFVLRNQCQWGRYKQRTEKGYGGENVCRHGGCNFYPKRLKHCPIFSADCTGTFVSTPFCPVGIKMAVHIKTLQKQIVWLHRSTHGQNDSLTGWHYKVKTHLPVVQTTKNTRGVFDQRLLDLTLLR